MSIRFRRKRPQLVKSAFSAKDWISLTLSVLALGLSIATAYYNIWRQEDDVSVVAHLPPLAVRTPNDRLVVPSVSETNLAFINSGNRPVAIMTVGLTYVQSRLEDGEECPFDLSIRLQTDFKPLVVKPNEVATATIRITEGVWYDNDDIKRDVDNRFSFPILDDNKAKARFPMEICLEVNLTTPERSGHLRSPAIYRYWIEGNGGWSWAFDREGPILGRPLRLVKESWSFLSYILP